MPIRPQTTAAPAPPRRALPGGWPRLLRRLYRPVVLGMIGLNAWWLWEARPIPSLKIVERWVGVERETGSRQVAWWDFGDVPRDNRGAVSILRRAVKRSPNDGDARILLGRALGAADDLRGCAEQLRRVPSWWPKKAEAQYGEGMAWLRLKRMSDAEKAFLGYLEPDPNHPKLLPHRAPVEESLLDLYAVEDRWDDAQALIWRAYAAAKDFPTARLALLNLSLRTRLERAHPAIALETLREYLAADPDDWDARRALAHFANLEKRYDEADRAIARCLAERPKDPRAWADRLEMLESRQDAAGLSAALKDVPPEADVEGRVWMIRGRALRQAKDYEGAARAFQKALELLPDDSDAHFSLAFALQVLGRTEEAEAHRKRHAELEALSREVPDAINAYKDATDAASPKPDEVRRAMLRLAAACKGMGWTKDAEGWTLAASEV